MHSTKIPSISLSNGVEMPAVGFGVAALGSGKEFYAAIDAAIENGYRLFDTAPFYDNEKETGDALRHCGVPREELFIIDKLPNACHGFDDAIAAYERALDATGLDYLDMFIIHFPAPGLGKYHEAWHALEKLYKDGRVRSIGVGSFQEKHLMRIFEDCEIKPHSNQLECNPYLSITPLRKLCRDNGVQVVNWFPLGGPREPLMPYPVENYKVLLEDPVIREIGEQYGKSPAQVILRWALDNDIVPIPKSSNPKRIAENRNIFDFRLNAEDMDKLALLDHGRRLGPEPDEFNDITMG